MSVEKKLKKSDELLVGTLDMHISIAISTFNADYIFVKEENFDKALNVLASEGYGIV